MPRKLVVVGLFCIYSVAMSKERCVVVDVFVYGGFVLGGVPLWLL